MWLNFHTFTDQVEIIFMEISVFKVNSVCMLYSNKISLLFIKCLMLVVSIFRTSIRHFMNNKLIL